MNQDELLEHLRVIHEGVQTGDTLEGRISFTVIDAETWDVDGAYRIGNMFGQGGCVLLESATNADAVARCSANQAEPTTRV